MAKRLQEAPLKRGDKVVVIPFYRTDPIFRGRITRFCSDKNFVYVVGRFNRESYKFLPESHSSVEINVALQHVKIDETR